jgi:predicted phosphodiesterase
LTSAVRFSFGCDNHGNECDERAVKVFHEFNAYFKPTIRIHGGDAFNFARLRKAAKDDERRKPIKDDLDAGLAFFDEFKPTHFLRGNHDERLWDSLASDDGALKDFAGYAVDDIVAALNGGQMFPYGKRRGVMQLGDYRFVHGFAAGLHATKKHAETYGNVIHGHNHAPDIYQVPRLENTRGIGAGCLCKLDQDYNRAHINTLRQAHGFVYGILTPTNRLVVWEARSVDGEWYFPSEFDSCETKPQTEPQP